MIGSKKDPSLKKIALGEYWNMSESAKKQTKKDFGEDLEKLALLNLGYATIQITPISKAKWPAVIESIFSKASYVSKLLMNKSLIILRMLFLRSH